MKKLAIFILTALLVLSPVSVFAADMEMDIDNADVEAAVFEEGEIAVSTEDISIDAPSAILIEKETGTVLYEKNADERMEPASVTKVMTILLIVEAIESGSISLESMVPVSEYAESMGGSQIYLEQGEQMSVHDMLKSIVVSSANDAAVAMAEYIAGTEQAFVSKMNQRAQELGMKNTVFCNCTGLLDTPEHLTTARDIALMSRELIGHDMIKEYTTIWTDSVRNGEFGLSNTNKLVRFYEGATGLKTGFTQGAMYCLSATAERDGVEYIAVVLHCETSPQRFESAKTLLSYAFANYTLVDVSPDKVIPPMPVTLGESDYIQPVLESENKILVEKAKAASITKILELDEGVLAPVTAGQQVGKLTVEENGNLLAEIPIISDVDVARLTWGQIFFGLLSMLFFGAEA